VRFGREEGGGYVKKYGFKGGAGRKIYCLKGRGHLKYYLIDGFHGSAKVPPE